MQIDQAHYTERRSRTEYLNGRFGGRLKGRVLDVGCDEAVLKDLRPDLEYTGVDIGGRPDIRLDLEAAERLPFDDDAFDAVVCCDVLEHLDNLHAMFDELLRVSRGVAVVSLPNCWFGARRPIARGRGGFGHYGLPVDRPVDRHKWFFSLSEGAAFVRARAERSGWRVEEDVAVEKPKAAIWRWLRRGRYPSRACYLNRYAHTLWVVLTA